MLVWGCLSIYSGKTIFRFVSVAEIFDISADLSNFLKNLQGRNSFIRWYLFLNLLQLGYIYWLTPLKQSVLYIGVKSLINKNVSHKNSTCLHNLVQYSSAWSHFCLLSLICAVIRLKSKQADQVISYFCILSGFSMFGISVTDIQFHYFKWTSGHEFIQKTG